MLSIYRGHLNVVDLSRTSQCCWFIENISVLSIYWEYLDVVDLSRTSQCCQFIENISMLLIYGEHLKVVNLSSTSQCCPYLKNILMLPIYQELLNVFWQICIFYLGSLHPWGKVKATGPGSQSIRRFPDQIGICNYISNQLMNTHHNFG